MKIVKKISKILFWIILVIIAIYSTFVIIQRLIYKDKTPSFFGYKNFIVLTGSMEIVFVKETNDIKVNDIISFRINNSVVTHRVKEIYKEDGKDFYITKGDANTGTDTELINIEIVEGKYSFKIPFLGRIILFFQKPIGIIVLFTVLVIFSSIKPKKIKKI